MSNSSDRIPVVPAPTYPHGDHEARWVHSPSVAEFCARCGKPRPLPELAWELQSLRAALWSCYIHSGADTDGVKSADEFFAVVQSPRPEQVVAEAVARLRSDYDEALQEPLT